MKNISKFAIFICLILQFTFSYMDSEVVGYCPAGCQQVFTGFIFGFPIPVFRMGWVVGCTTIPNLLIDFIMPECLLNVGFWIIVICILEYYWPYARAKKEFIGGFVGDGIVRSCGAVGHDCDECHIKCNLNPMTQEEDDWAFIMEDWENNPYER